MNQVYLGMGSNLNDPVNQIKTAINELTELRQTTVLAVSSFYKNPPIGITEQPDFFNAVAKIDTTLTPDELLDALLTLEQKHQRFRTIKNGPRTLDLDILLYGGKKIDCSRLQIPHPRLKERAFVVIPLAEISPSLILPCGTPLNRLLDKFNDCNFDILSYTKEML